MSFYESIGLHYGAGIDVELEQAADEGKDVSALKALAEAARTAENPVERDRLAAALMDEVQRMPSGPQGIEEPDELEAIRALRPALPALPPAPVGDELNDRILGAWLARCAGCLLGKPVEGWRRERITGLLRDTGNYPPAKYMSTDVPEALHEKYDFGKPGQRRCFINEVDGMPPDDDTNYTLLGLLMMEKHGYALTTDDVGMGWLGRLPVLATFTAERVTYRNLLMGVEPPQSASFRNPYREWIGAQIRADFYGYACPGDPERAAALAYADAALSHTRNGIYGEMFVAAMLAAAYCTSDMRAIIEAGLAQIPAKCRLAKAVREAMAWSETMSWEEAVNKVHEVWDEANRHHWCHTISNAAIVVLSLMYSGGDLERGIGIALVSAFDTDCNCATAGSIIGVAKGAAALPQSWIAPLNDTLHTSLAQEATLSIADLARRTRAVIDR